MADPAQVVRGVADLVDVELLDDWHPVAEHRRQADGRNAAWVTALRAALDR